MWILHVDVAKGGRRRGCGVDAVGVDGDGRGEGVGGRMPDMAKADLIRLSWSCRKRASLVCCILRMQRRPLFLP